MVKALKKAAIMIMLFFPAMNLLWGCAKKSAESGFTAASPANAAVNDKEEISLYAAYGSGNKETESFDEELIEDIKRKYSADEIYEYADEILKLSRNGTAVLSVTCDMNIIQSSAGKWNQVVALYQDSDFEYQMRSMYNWDEETKKLTIVPPREALFGISDYNLPDDEPGKQVGSFHLFDKGENNDWGNLGKFYMVQYYDLATGNALDKPLVTVVTTEAELKTPIKLKYSQTDDGLLKFEWNPVEGALKYFIVKADFNEELGYTGNLFVLDETTDCMWQTEKSSAGNTTMNSDFMSFLYSADDWNDEQTRERLLKEKPDATEGKPIKIFNGTSYGIIAVNKEGSSLLSNLVNEEDIIKTLPYSEAYYTKKDESNDFQSNILTLPSHRWIVMCDGNMSQRLVLYDTDRAVEKKVHLGRKENEEIYFDDVMVLYLPYSIEGTTFTGTIQLQGYDENDVNGQLKKLKDRQALFEEAGDEESKTGAGDNDIVPGNADNKEQPENSEVQTDTQEAAAAVSGDTVVTATCALSEYIARNMLEGKATVDLKDFKESLDEDYLNDAVEEAIHQNPLILGIKSVEKNERSLSINYTDSNEVRNQKKEMTDNISSKIIKEIIKTGMDDLDKEIAINSYLCRNTEYDWNAYQNAKKNDYVQTDNDYLDSYTAYGVLVRKKGVCEGYAGAFKVLADEAGLENIIVTGVTNGTTPHAWNRVMVEDEWRNVDLTSNDNEQLGNAIFNLPDEVAEMVLVQDKAFLMDSHIGQYTSDDDEYEYYHVKNSFFERSEISSKLAEGLARDSKAALRTDYTLGDDDFYNIAQEVLAEKTDPTLQGYYWMGVIYMSTSSPDLY